MRYLLFVLVVILCSSTFAQRIKLSKESEIAVMTLGPYQPELYSAFGHSAIRVTDPQNNLNYVYNYGVFDFDQENFYWNFARGQMIYMLGMSYYEPFRDFYIEQDRTVREQVLNLSLAQRQAFFEFLQVNYQPQNREYLYNYVYDNCATKIPEVVDKVLGNELKFDTTYVVPGKTIRDLMHDYLQYQPWGEWIIDIGLGSQIDKEASAQEFMFLPDYVYEAFSKATIRDSSDWKPLVSKDLTIYKKRGAPEEIGWFTPFNVFILLFFIGGIITHRNMKYGKRTRWLDGLLFGFAGFMGLWLVFLWAGTVHLSKWNYDLLWAIPFHLVAVFTLSKENWRKFNRWYFKSTAILYGLLLIAWALLPEPIHMSLVPFVLLLLLRSAYITYSLKKA